MGSVEKLRELLQEDIGRFDGESERHKKLYRRSQNALIILTGATTVLAGAGLVVHSRYDNYLQFLVLVFSAVTTGVTAYMEMRRARELWHHEREVYYALKDILREVDFYASIKELTFEETESFFKRASAVLGSSTHKWTRIQERKSTDINKGTSGD